MQKHLANLYNAKNEASRQQALGGLFSALCDKMDDVAQCQADMAKEMGIIRDGITQRVEALEDNWNFVIRTGKAIAGAGKVAAKATSIIVIIGGGLWALVTLNFSGASQSLKDLISFL